MKQKEVYWLGNVKMNEQIYKSILDHFAKELELLKVCICKLKKSHTL